MSVAKSKRMFSSPETFLNLIKAGSSGRTETNTGGTNHKVTNYRETNQGGSGSTPRLPELGGLKGLEELVKLSTPFRQNGRLRAQPTGDKSAETSGNGAVRDSESEGSHRKKSSKSTTMGPKRVCDFDNSGTGGESSTSIFSIGQ